MSPQAQQMGEPVEMEGKLNGKPVYLTSEVTEGFPTDNPTFTRGTQITNADGMSSFGVTAFLGKQKYMDHVEIKKSADSWKPETDYFGSTESLSTSMPGIHTTQQKEQTASQPA